MEYAQCLELPKLEVADVRERRKRDVLDRSEAPERAIHTGVRPTSRHGPFQSPSLSLSLPVSHTYMYVRVLSARRKSVGNANGTTSPRGTITSWAFVFSTRSADASSFPDNDLVYSIPSHPSVVDSLNYVTITFTDQPTSPSTHSA